MKFNSSSSNLSPRVIAIASALIFVVAFAVRLLSWHDTRREVGKVQSVVAGDYKRTGQLFREGGLSGFFSTAGPLADPNQLGHPPGYPIVRAVLATLFGDSDTAAQFFQITCDALAAVVIFLIAVEIFSMGVGIIVGLLSAFSPQFAWNSVLLLPDTLAVLPILLAVYLLTRAMIRPRLATVIMAGVFVGLSCWLRANALLMAPFLAGVVLFLFPKEQRLRYGAALLLAALLTVVPLTLRNWIVFQHFIPVSLGAGQTMLEGISDYDPSRRFGIPDTDMGIMKMEAEQYNRPDYYSTLFAPDGIKRERMRLARGFGVIGDNPVWFAGVMIRRAGSMLRLERARLISASPPVTHASDLDGAQLVWKSTISQQLEQASGKSAAAKFLAGEDTLQIISDETKYGEQMRTPPIATNRGHDYQFRIPVLVDEGRMTIEAVANNGSVYSSAVVEKAEVKEGNAQPKQLAEVAVVSTGEDVALSFKNAAPASGKSVVRIGQIELFDLGESSFLWSRYPRILVRGIQKLFITAVMLPLSIIGLGILVRRRAWPRIILLLSVPAYYFCFQSILHTEYRYVLVIHYFLFVLAAVTLNQVVRFVANPAGRRNEMIPASL